MTVCLCVREDLNIAVCVGDTAWGGIFMSDSVCANMYVCDCTSVSPSVWSSLLGWLRQRLEGCGGLG